MAYYKVNHSVKYNGTWYQAGDKIKVEQGDEKFIEAAGGYLIHGLSGKPLKQQKLDLSIEEPEERET